MRKRKIHRIRHTYIKQIIDSIWGICYDVWDAAIHAAMRRTYRLRIPWGRNAVDGFFCNNRKENDFAKAGTGCK